jgi:uncharacterized protein YgiM (DUF1202 family)
MAKWLQLLFVVTLAIWMSILAPTTTTYAQTTTTTPSLGQDVVRVLEGNWQTLSPGTQHWYRFDYAGDELPVRISLDINPAGSAGFQVWTAEQFSQLATDANVTPVALSAADPDDPTHIMWAGPLSNAGTYYIVIQPSTATNSADTTADTSSVASAQYLLNIGGRGLAPALDGGSIVAGDLNVNVRSGPSTAYSVLQTIAQGTELSVLGQDTSANWLFVQLPDRTEGWIARFLTGFTGTAMTVTTPAQPSLAPPSTAANAAAVIAGAVDVNLRAGPSTAYPVLSTLAQSTQFTVLGQDSTGTWLSIRFSDGSEGWIARYLTDFANNAPLVAAPIVAQPQLAPPATTAANQVFVSSALDAKLRTGPSTLYPVISAQSKSTPLTVLGQDPTSNWLSVQLADGTQGWMARFLTNYAGIATTLEVPALVQPSPTQPQLAPSPTVNVGPSVGSLPFEVASLDNFPVEQALSNNRRVLNAGQTQWLTFDQPGNGEPIQIWMSAEPNNATGFRIYREGDAHAIMAGANPDDFTDIGRGTLNPNEPADFFWRGDFEETGRFYVMVDSNATNDIVYSIYGVASSPDQSSPEDSRDRDS